MQCCCGFQRIAARPHIRSRIIGPPRIPQPPRPCVHSRSPSCSPPAGCSEAVAGAGSACGVALVPAVWAKPGTTTAAVTAIAPASSIPFTRTSVDLGSGFRAISDERYASAREAIPGPLSLTVRRRRRAQESSRCKYCATKSQPTMSLYASVSRCVTGPGTSAAPKLRPFRVRTPHMHKLVEVRKHSSAV